MKIEVKVKNIALGILLIAFAIFGILEVSGAIPPLSRIAGGLTYVQIISGAVLTVLFVESLCKRRFCTAMFMLAFIFMIFERNIAFYLFSHHETNLINNWLLLLFTAIICIGLRLIIPKKIKRIGDGHKIGVLSEGTNYDGYNEHNFTSATEYIDCSSFTTKRFESNFGQLLIHFTNVYEYVGERRVYIENNFGKTVIHVPKDWRIMKEIENNFGGVKDENSNASGPVLYLCGENNFGYIEINRV